MNRILPRSSASACSMLGGVLVCALLFLPAIQASAQNNIQFWLVHAGEPLPSGTVVVILEKPGEPGRTGAIQPEFLSVDEYPRETAGAIHRDTLATGGRTATAFPRTQSAGVLYFLYALTPDDEVYASYSAEHGQLKFDVAQSGAMSVAPIADERVQADIRSLFFESERASEELVAGASDPETEAETDRVADSEETTPTEIPDSDTFLAGDESASELAADPGVPNALTTMLGVLCLFLLAATAFLLMRYRRLRSEHERLLAAGTTAEELRRMEQELATMEEKYHAVKASCETLLDRYDRLSSQLERARRITKEPR